MISFHDCSEILFSLTFGAGRLICGINAGIASFLVPLYSKFHLVREMAPCQDRGALGAINQFMITLGKNYSGILVSYLVGYLFTVVLSTYEFAIFLFPIVFSVIQFFLVKFMFNQESANKIVQSEVSIHVSS